MVAFKIFTVSTEKPANEAYDRLAAEVQTFVNALDQEPEIEWLQSAQGEYSVRLTAIVKYRPIMEAYS